MWDYRLVLDSGRPWNKTSSLVHLLMYSASIFSLNLGKRELPYRTCPSPPPCLPAWGVATARCLARRLRPLYEHPPSAQQSMCRCATLFLLWTWIFYKVCSTFAAFVDPLMLILSQVRRTSAPRPGGDFIFICFVGHSAPFLYSDCLNTPARWLDSVGKSWKFGCILNYSHLHKFSDLVFQLNKVVHLKFFPFAVVKHPLKLKAGSTLLY